MTDTPRVLDLDAARQARLEKKGPPPVVKQGGKNWALPAELPSEVVTGFGMAQRGDISGLDSALEALFGEQYADFKAEGLSWPDEEALLEGVLELYGFDLPGSSASAPSS